MARTPKTDAGTTEPGTEIDKFAGAAEMVVGGRRFDDALLRNVTTYDEAMRLAAAAFGGVDTVTDHIGNGFALLSGHADKARLVDKGFLILHIGFSQGEYGEFCSVMAVTEKSERVIFNDGSTGVFAQLRDLVTETGRHGGFAVPHGLTESVYDTCTECGRPCPKAVDACRHCEHVSEARSTGRTFYLSTAA